MNHLYLYICGSVSLPTTVLWVTVGAIDAHRSFVGWMHVRRPEYGRFENQSVGERGLEELAEIE
jgi:hypothetical protein